MKDALYIKSRLNNISTEIIPQTPEANLKHKAKLETLIWIYNNGEPRSEEELKNRLRNLDEELLGFEFMNTKGLPVDIVNAKKYEVNLILE